MHTKLINIQRVLSPARIDTTQIHKSTLRVKYINVQSKKKQRKCHASTGAGPGSHQRTAIVSRFNICMFVFVVVVVVIVAHSARFTFIPFHVV